MREREAGREKVREEVRKGGREERSVERIQETKRGSDGEIEGDTGMARRRERRRK